MNNDQPKFSKLDFGLSVSDVMTALLLVFILLLSAALLQQAVNVDKANTYISIRDSLQKDLYVEFKEDFKDWNARMDSNLVIRFYGPEVKFEAGESEIPDRFKNILVDFFPRYIKVLTQRLYKEHIEEIRIEGHTSSEDDRAKTEEQAYLFNMELSQDRTRSVLNYVLTESMSITNPGDKPWVRSRLTANGLSSSKLIMDDSGNEDRYMSRRVEFRVRLNADQFLRTINELDQTNAGR